MRTPRKSKSRVMKAAAAQKLLQRAKDEATFRAFFLELEANKGHLLARRAMDTSRVEEALQRLIPRVERRAKIEKMHDAARELSQSWFARAFEVGLLLYRTHFTFTQYASFLLHNVAQPLDTMQRRAEREGPLGAEAVSEMIDAMPDAMPSRQQICRELSSYEHVIAQLEQLSERLRTPAMMVWVDGLKVNETAERLNVKRGTISSRLHRAKRVLGPLLQRHPEPPPQLPPAAN